MKSETLERIHKHFNALRDLREQSDKYGIGIEVSLGDAYGWVYVFKPKFDSDLVHHARLIWREDESNVFFTTAPGEGGLIAAVDDVTDEQADYLLETITADVKRVLREIRDAVEKEKLENSINEQYEDLIANQSGMKGFAS